MTPSAAQSEARRIVREARRLADLRTRTDQAHPLPDWQLARDAALLDLIAEALEREFWPSSKPMFWWRFACGYVSSVCVVVGALFWWWLR